MTRKRIVVAGFGDTGVLVAIHLADEHEVVGISPKPCLVSGQELGLRLTRPELWKQDYLTDFGRYEKLDGVRVVQGSISKIDPDAGHVLLTRPCGTEQTEPYDVLVIASGVTAGFWRNAALEDARTIAAGIDTAAARLREADTIAVVGGGATGVSSAANIAGRYPEKSVHLFYSQAAVLPGYHPRVRRRLEAELERAGVQRHPGHRARIPVDFACDRLATEPVEWTTGQPRFEADLTLWAVGNAKPNSGFIPAAMLDGDGFVRVDDTLRVVGHANVFAVGDIAASDPNRSSARNWGAPLVAHNIRCFLAGDEQRMKRFEAPAHRWGSILGVQDDGLQIFQPNGGRFRFPRWFVDRILFPIAVRRVIYKGIRRAGDN